MKNRNNTYSLLPLSEFVKTKRKELGLTQKELADKAGVGLRFIRELEKAKPSLQLNKVNQVLMLFGFEVGPVPLNRKKLINEES
ncbi:MAG: transcriptional regulator [Bacteroidetes bacterium]|nr:MAG: transcriptional regulator [Bacteroidota bacterium]RLD61157.1 MAG: transcriptional regulator [Bacteroidota bacterium]